MAQVSIIAKITAQPGRRDEVAAVLSGVLTHANEEPGTLAYSLHADGADDDVLWMYELYADQQALTDHSQTETFKALGGAVGALLAGRPELHFAVPVGGKGL